MGRCGSVASSMCHTFSPSPAELGVLPPVIPHPPSNALSPRGALFPWGCPTEIATQQQPRRQWVVAQPQETCTACCHRAPGDPRGGDRSDTSPSRAAGPWMVPVGPLAPLTLTSAGSGPQRGHVGVAPYPGDIFIPRRVTGRVPGQGESPCTCPQWRGHSWGGHPVTPAQGGSDNLGCLVAPAHPAAVGNPGSSGGGGEARPPEPPWSVNLSLSSARSRVAGVPTLGPGQQPRARHHRSPTAHLYAKCQLPIGLCCPPIPTALGVLKGLTPHTQRVPTVRAPWPEHHPSSRTTGAKAGPQCAGVPSPRQPPSPSAGCLQVTRRLAMGDFSQLGMKS